MGAEQRVLQQDNRALLHTVFSSSACMSWREESIPDSTWVHNSPTWNEPSVEQVVGFTTFLPMCWRASCWREGQVEAQFSSPLGNTGGYKVCSQAALGAALWERLIQMGSVRHRHRFLLGHGVVLNNLPMSAVHTGPRALWVFFQQPQRNPRIYLYGKHHYWQVFWEEMGW